MRSRRPLLLVLAACIAVYWPLVAGRVVGAGDALRLYIPDAQLLLESFRAFSLPHWTQKVGLGQPLGASLQAQAFYPVRWLSLLTLDAVTSVSVLHLLHVWIAAAGAFLAARRFRVSNVGAVVVALAYAAGPLFTHLASRPNLAAAAAWTPWIFYAAHAVASRRSLRRVALLALFVALSVLSAAPEILVGQILLGGVVLCRRGIRPLLAGAAAGAWALALAAITLLPFLEFVRESNRVDGAVALAWSASPPQLLSLFWLNADLPRARGAFDQQLVLSLFLGTSVAILIAFAVSQRLRRVRWLLIPTALLLLFALGTHVPWVRYVLGALPFRYPAKHLITAAFPLCLLAGFGVSPLVRSLQRAMFTRLVAGFVGVLVLCAVTLPVQRAGAAAGLVFGSLFALFLVVGARRVSQSVVIVVVAAELLCAHALLGMPEWVSGEKMRTPSTLIAKSTLLLGERVAINPLVDDDEAPSVDNAESRRLLLPNRFVEDGLSGVTAYGSPLPERTERVMETADIVLLELLSVRYGIGYWRKENHDDVTQLQPSPRAWLVGTTEAVTDAEALDVMLTEPRKTEKVAVGEGLPVLATELTAEANAELEALEPSTMKVKTNAPVQTVLVTSDLWYPGWQVFVDGAEAPLLRANYLMRAVSLTPGAHDVLFRYQPTRFTLAATLSFLALVACGICLTRSGRPRRPIAPKR